MLVLILVATRYVGNSIYGFGLPSVSNYISEKNQGMF